MTPKESLEILDKVCGIVDGMTDDELFDFMMEKSDSFRKEISKIDMDMNCATSSAFMTADSFVATTYSIPTEICTSSTYTEEDVFKRTEEVEDFEWQMMTEAA